MDILVINAGSSSLKFTLFRGEEAAARGHYLDIGETVAKPECLRKTEVLGAVHSSCMKIRDHGEAIVDMLGLLKESAVLSPDRGLAAIGHRVVHGGERYGAAAPVTAGMLDYLRGIADLAPLHNPVGIACINELAGLLPGVPQYAVFDTAFHRTMPEAVYRYALPPKLCDGYGIRKYGFHGTSHKYAAHRAAGLLGRDIAGMNIVTCHLGNGQSICAVRGGRSVDTSMGFTPLEGLPMGTRSGSFDPEVVLFLLEKGLGPDRIKAIVNRESGLLGVSGIDSHYKVIEEKARAGDRAAKLACDMLVNRITCFIGGYCAEMGGVDAIVFTGGIGENSAFVREQVLSHFGYLGLVLDAEANAAHGAIITAPSSAVRALVIPANEELQIAREVAEALGEGR